MLDSIKGAFILRPAVITVEIRIRIPDLQYFNLKVSVPARDGHSAAEVVELRRGVCMQTLSTSCHAWGRASRSSSVQMRKRGQTSKALWQSRKGRDGSIFNFHGSSEGGWQLIEDPRDQMAPGLWISVRDGIGSKRVIQPQG